MISLKLPNETQKTEPVTNQVFKNKRTRRTNILCACDLNFMCNRAVVIKSPRTVVMMKES